AVLVGSCKPILRDFRPVGTPPLGAQSKLAAVCESQISPGHQLSRPDAPVHSGGPLGSPAGLVGTHWATNGCASAFMRHFFIMSLYRMRRALATAAQVTSSGARPGSESS